MAVRTFKTEIDSATGASKLVSGEPLLEALALAVKDGKVDISYDEVNSTFHVSVLDGDEWGMGADLETALLFALGAHFHVGPEGY